VRLTLAWCAIAASWIIVKGPDDRVREAAMWAIMGLAASVVCGYYDDNSARHHISERKDKEPEKDPE
jgi:hypothetical protein